MCGRRTGLQSNGGSGFGPSVLRSGATTAWRIAAVVIEIFNVAITQARAALIVVGDKHTALNSGRRLIVTVRVLR